MGHTIRAKLLSLFSSSTTDQSHPESNTKLQRESTLSTDNANHHSSRHERKCERRERTFERRQEKRERRRGGCCSKYNQQIQQPQAIQVIHVAPVVAMRESRDVVPVEEQAPPYVEHELIPDSKKVLANK